MKLMGASEVVTEDFASSHQMKDLMKVCALLYRQGWEFGPMAPKMALDSFIEHHVHKPETRLFVAVHRLRAKNYGISCV